VNTRIASASRTAAILRLVSLVAVLLRMLALPVPAQAATFVVNDLGDGNDGVCDHLSCTLREAIIAANIHPGPDTIWVNIESGSPNWTIWLGSPLPTLADDATTIDATTMPEFLGGPSVFLVGDDDIDHALLIESTGNTIMGFKFTSFRGDWGGAPIIVSVGGNRIEDNVLSNSTHGLILRSSNNVVRDNLIGVIPWGGASPNDSDGVVIEGHDNLIEENVIANNGGAGPASKVT
jgi:CSLREA domain-containing protein